MAWIGWVVLISKSSSSSLGSLESSDETATRLNLRSFSLYRDYSYPLTLSNVGEPSWS